jgi:peptidoglycan/xylan/chitin deacetylase (PgdA/CDA1 family)
MSRRTYSLFLLFLLLVGLIAWHNLPQAHAVSGNDAIPSGKSASAVVPAGGQMSTPEKNSEEKNIKPAVANPDPGAGLNSAAQPITGIVLTFDDKSVDEWYSFLVFNHKYGVKATFYVSFFYKMDLDQIIKLKLLQDAKNEIGYHTMNHLNALKYIKENSMEAYIDNEILPGLNLMRQKGFDVKSFAYPYGVGSPDLDKELLKYFKTVRYTAYPAKGKKLADVSSAYLKDKRQRVISAVGIDNGYGNSTEDILQGIDKAYNKHELLLLYGHVISDKPGSQNTSMKRLETIIQYAQKKGMQFHTASELGI